VRAVVGAWDVEGVVGLKVGLNVGMEEVGVKLGMDEMGCLVELKLGEEKGLEEVGDFVGVELDQKWAWKKLGILMD
jgi:hypothetical protein